ncbi:hypothetical protein CIHG_06913 [Coccidioides immitis H538.4]|uniref:Uncharacterized protein n=3 Tax=Coccidioides immitis TaxID=5501 RepID=A0A0J8R1D6_COCIT|nr:hypothetical protein CIRG_09958 [Coccidioides immitis RMSCC 2394]KMU78551.1 hypothetical protein CISG_07211 [Coccidioides immitis RMSCC 3703]KMU89243.1 hypothetical protein CIHG_06913 [Coccidioides immitis H538.4]
MKLATYPSSSASGYPRGEGPNSLLGIASGFQASQAELLHRSDENDQADAPVRFNVANGPVLVESAHSVHLVLCRVSGERRAGTSFVTLAPLASNRRPINDQSHGCHRPAPCKIHYGRKLQLVTRPTSIAVHQQSQPPTLLSHPACAPMDVPENWKLDVARAPGMLIQLRR